MNWEGGLWIKIKQEKIYGKEDTAENYILEEWGQSMFMLWSSLISASDSERFSNFIITLIANCSNT